MGKSFARMGRDELCGDKWGWIQVYVPMQLGNRKGIHPVKILIQ